METAVLVVGRADFWSDPMRTTATRRKAPDQPEPVEFWDRFTVLAYFGGDRPLHLSTLYRGVQRGIYPKPVNLSANCVRWVASECHAAAQRMVAARDEPMQLKPRRGRPRRQPIT